MAFDPTKSIYQPTSNNKVLPVVLLLDVSGSMSYDGKIEKLYEATKKMIKTFVDLELKETTIDIAIITFGSSVSLHTPMTSVKNIASLKPFSAGGGTPLGEAFLMATDMMDDNTILPKGKIYKPAVIVVSDGRPDSGWRKGFATFEAGDRASKSQRFAVAIGNDRDEEMLAQFTKNKDNVFYAETAEEIADKLEKISTHISKRAMSGTPNVIPQAHGATYDNNNVTTNGTIASDEDEYV